MAKKVKNLIVKRHNGVPFFKDIDVALKQSIISDTMGWASLKGKILHSIDDGNAWYGNTLGKPDTTLYFKSAIVNGRFVGSKETFDIFYKNDKSNIWGQQAPDGLGDSRLISLTPKIDFTIDVHSFSRTNGMFNKISQTVYTDDSRLFKYASATIPTYFNGGQYSIKIEPITTIDKQLKIHTSYNIPDFVKAHPNDWQINYKTITTGSFLNTTKETVPDSYSPIIRAITKTGFKEMGASDFKFFMNEKWTNPFEGTKVSHIGQDIEYDYPKKNWFSDFLSGVLFVASFAYSPLISSAIFVGTGVLTSLLVNNDANKIASDNTETPDEVMVIGDDDDMLGIDSFMKSIDSSIDFRLL